MNLNIMVSRYLAEKSRTEGGMSLPENESSIACATIKQVMSELMLKVREEQAVDSNVYLHCISLTLFGGQRVRMLTRANSYERGLRRECRMQEIWAWFRQNPSLTRLEIGRQQLEDMFATSSQVEQFERMALEVIRNA